MKPFFPDFDFGAGICSNRKLFEDDHVMDFLVGARP